MRLGYSEFIDEHKTKAVLTFVVSILIIFIAPLTYNRIIFNIPNLAMKQTFYMASVSIFIAPKTLKQFYYQILESNPSSVPATFEEYARLNIPYFIENTLQFIIFWFAIISLIIVLVQHFKHKKVNKPLIYLPLMFYIIYILVDVIISTTKSIIEIPFVGFYLAIILEVLVILYCAGFQHFPAHKPREHKPTDKERIAELERQVAELKEKDAE